MRFKTLETAVDVVANRRSNIIALLHQASQEYGMGTELSSSCPRVVYLQEWLEDHQLSPQTTLIRSYKGSGLEAVATLAGVPKENANALVDQPLDVAAFDQANNILRVRYENREFEIPAGITRSGDVW